jgi:hypothetical protein
MNNAYMLKNRCKKLACINMCVSICNGLKFSDFGKYKPRMLLRLIEKALAAA